MEVPPAGPDGKDGSGCIRIMMASISRRQFQSLLPDGTQAATSRPRSSTGRRHGRADGHVGITPVGSHVSHGQLNRTRMVNASLSATQLHYGTVCGSDSANLAARAVNFRIA